MIWGTISSSSCILLMGYSFSIFGCKEYNPFDFSIDHWVMSICRVVSCYWKRVFAMTSVFSWQHVSFCSASLCRTSPVAQMVRNPSGNQETKDPSLDWKDPLEKGMATHSSILAWRIWLTEEPGELKSMGLQRVRHNWVTLTLSELSPVLLKRTFAVTSVSLDKTVSFCRASFCSPRANLPCYYRYFLTS